MTRAQLLAVAFATAVCLLSGCHHEHGSSGGPPDTGPLPSTKELTAFSFLVPPATGSIDESQRSIAVVVPPRTDVTKLVASFATTGERVSVGDTTQVSGATSNDFTRPVTYVVTACDGSTAEYLVTVKIEEERACPSPAGQVNGYTASANGAASASNLAVSMCGAGTVVFEGPNTTPPYRALLHVGAGSATRFTFGKPSDAYDPFVIVQISVAAEPGIYTSADSRACGSVLLQYDVPPSPGLDCSGTIPPVCPKGCWSLCADTHCTACMPQAKTVAYKAAAADDCLGETQSAAGSWTVTLTSVSRAEGPDTTGLFHFVAHGAITAMLPEAAGTDGATFTADF